MNNSSYWISLDIHDTASQAVLAVKKGDNSRKICASLTENGKEYAIAEGCTAVFTAKKPDGTKLYNDCVIVDNSIAYVTTNNTTSAVGLVECEFRLISPEDKLLVCPRFTLIVEDTVVNDDDVMDSSDEFSALSKMVGRVERADSVAQEALETAEEALEKANRADDLVDGYEEATNTLILTHDDIVSGGYVEALKELNAGSKFTFWVGTTDEYNAITEKVNNCFYILTDDANRNEIIVQLGELQRGLETANAGITAANEQIINMGGQFETIDEQLTSLTTRVNNTASTYYKHLFGGEILASSFEGESVVTIDSFSDYKLLSILIGLRDSATGKIVAYCNSHPAIKFNYADGTQKGRVDVAFNCFESGSTGASCFRLTYDGDNITGIQYDAATLPLGDTLIIYHIVGII